MKKVLFGTGSLLFIALVSYVWFFQYNKPHLDVSGKKADFKVSAAQLIDEFEKNPTEADKKYQGKILEIQADNIEITEIKEKGETGYIANVSLPEKSYTLSIRLAKKNEVSPTKNVILKGIYSGYIEAELDMEIPGSIQLMRGIILK